MVSTVWDAIYTKVHTVHAYKSNAQPILSIQYNILQNNTATPYYLYILLHNMYRWYVVIVCIDVN